MRKLFVLPLLTCTVQAFMIAPSARGVTRARAPSMEAIDDDRLSFVSPWEAEQVEASAKLLESIRANEFDLMSRIEVFLEQNPPACSRADTPDDVLG